MRAIRRTMRTKQRPPRKSIENESYPWDTTRLSTDSEITAGSIKMRIKTSRKILFCCECQGKLKLVEIPTEPPPTYVPHT